jgi:peptide/nickel transport system permease protein
MFGLAIVGFLFVVAIFAPLLANSQPIATRYEGRWYFPGVVDCFQRVPLVGGFVRKDAPFRLPSFDFKQSFDPKRDWALWSPVPYGPLEITPDCLASPSARHWLGTDSVGRDVASRMIHGAAVSLEVGFISMGIATLIGVIVGVMAGYFGGWVDIVVSRFIEIVMCFPSFFLILAILAWLPPDIKNVMVVIGLTGWTGIARYARGECMRLREVDYVQAARALGAGHVRVMLRHLLPNSLAPVLVSVTFGVASAILTEAGLSWLGFGVQPPDPSWGNILREGYDNMMTAPHVVPPPCVMIFVSVLAFNLVGDALRDAIDPRLREGGEEA